MKYEVDIKQVNYGYVIVEADSPEQAIEIVRNSQCEPNTIFTGARIEPIEANEAYI